MAKQQKQQQLHTSPVKLGQPFSNLNDPMHLGNRSKVFA
jgi:hypothetical protein